MNLARCRADEAYQFTVQSFVDAANRVLAEHDRSLLVETLRNAYDLGRNQTVPSFFDTSDVDQYPSPKKESLRMVKEAFFSVDYEARAALVLRDQCNLPYEEIASVLGQSLKEAKIRVTNARGVLRDKVAEILARMREGT